jgi:Mg2+/Co2+ transporter CorB
MIGDRIGNVGRKTAPRRIPREPFVRVATAMLAMLVAAVAAVLGNAVAALIVSDQSLSTVFVTLFAIAAGTSTIILTLQGLSRRQMRQLRELLALNRREDERYFAGLQSRLTHHPDHRERR